MKRQLLDLLTRVDRVAAGTRLALAPERPKLLCFLFHALYRDVAELADDVLLPAQRLHVDRLREFIDYFRNAGYRFVAPSDIVGNLPEGDRYVLISFDDGYYNNVHALPVLEEFDVPAVFCVVVNAVLSGKAFWWDAAHRNGARQAQIEAFKRRPTTEIERELAQRFGPSALEPVSDADRPFDVSELEEFARHRLVHIGNHTMDHAILSHCDSATQESQIRDAQDTLLRMTGYAPVLIAYPDGGYAQSAVAVARARGLRIGLTVEPHANRLPLGEEVMTLGRYAIRDDDRNCERLDMIRAGGPLSAQLSALRRRT